MSKISDYATNWLEKCGYELGYHETMMPNIAHLEIIVKHNIKVWEYMGYRCEKSFYSQRKPSALAIKDLIKKYGMDRKEYWIKPKKEVKLLPKLEDYGDGPRF
jgi:hypothetical protein